MSNKESFLSFCSVSSWVHTYKNATKWSLRVKDQVYKGQNDHIFANIVSLLNYVCI